jgi:hypothetical protein
VAKFYHFRQNNSGGVFCEPAQSLIVEANSPEEANRIACEHGAYFNGYGRDCSCCGDRWQACDEDDSEEYPHEYGQEVSDSDKVLDRDGGIRERLIVRLDQNAEQAKKL